MCYALWGKILHSFCLSLRIRIIVPSSENVCFWASIFLIISIFFLGEIQIFSLIIGILLFVPTKISKYGFKFRPRVYLHQILMISQEWNSHFKCEQKLVLKVASLFFVLFVCGYICIYFFFVKSDFMIFPHFFKYKVFF